MKILWLENQAVSCPTLLAALQTLGAVTLMSVDNPPQTANELDDWVRAILGPSVHADLIAGVGMTGWLASHVGARLGIPFVALNPAYMHAGDIPMAKNGCGLIRVSRDNLKKGGQQVLDELNQAYSPELIGEELLNNTEQLGERIKQFYWNSEIVYGLE